MAAARAPNPAAGRGLLARLSQRHENLAKGLALCLAVAFVFVVSALYAALDFGRTTHAEHLASEIVREQAGAGQIPVVGVSLLLRRELSVTQTSASPPPAWASVKVDTTVSEQNERISVTAIGSIDDGDVRITASIAPTPTPAPQRPPCDASHSVLYCVYTVQPGDTLSGIAGAFGIKDGEVSATDLLIYSNQPDIASDQDLHRGGQKLRIPAQYGVIHLVRSGEHATGIADIYGVNLADIALLPENRLTNLNQLEIGQELLIPNPRRFVKPALPTAPRLPAVQPTIPRPTATALPARAVDSAGAFDSSSASPPPTATASASASASGFIWPVTGRISSYFGAAHPLGIDIDLFSNPNAPIVAAATGKVIFAGGTSCCSYGLYVVVEHGNGVETLYAHLSSITVSAGQEVVQGQLIGYAGRTGYATGNHLHFEVHPAEAMSIR
jgi:murein DD-endopeptidase MepM/ murein hydrolase activator NlpD